MLQYKAKGRVGGTIHSEKKLSGDRNSVVFWSALFTAQYPAFFASSGVHSILEICWHRFRSIGGLAVKIISKIHFSLLYQWNITGRRLWPTDLNFSVSQTLALLDQTNWTCLKKKSLICYKKELDVYKQKLVFGTLSSFLIPQYFPNYHTVQSFYIRCFY